MDERRPQRRSDRRPTVVEVTGQQLPWTEQPADTSRARRQSEPGWGSALGRRPAVQRQEVHGPEPGRLIEREGTVLGRLSGPRGGGGKNRDRRGLAATRELFEAYRFAEQAARSPQGGGGADGGLQLVPWMSPSASARQMTHPPLGRKSARPVQRDHPVCTREGVPGARPASRNLEGYLPHFIRQKPSLFGASRRRGRGRSWRRPKTRTTVWRWLIRTRKSGFRRQWAQPPGTPREGECRGAPPAAARRAGRRRQCPLGRLGKRTPADRSATPATRRDQSAWLETDTSPTAQSPRYGA